MRVSLASLAARLVRPPIALLACAVIAAAVLLPGLAGPGLWEPHERQLADRVAPPSGVAPAQPRPQPPARPQPGQDDGCQRVAPADGVARSLTARAIELGRDQVGDDDGGRRLPLALLGLVAVLATAGIAMRAGGGRAGLLAGLVVLTFPLLVFQSRMLTSEIGTPCGGALIVYALVALAAPARGTFGRALDLLASCAALAAGLALAFASGGALLGLLVPIGAVAVAGAFGVPFITRALRRRAAPGGGPAAAPGPAYLPALAAALAVAGVAGLLAYQLYDLREPWPGIVPPVRQMFGKAIVPEPCYSWALGAVWRPEDDLRYIFDSTFEQIAYGTFPWGLLGVVAMAALLRDGDPARRRIGAITLAWASAAWIAGEVFQRRVGFTIWAGFPALAVAIGVWVDGALARRARGEPDLVPPAGALLVGLFVAIGAIDLGKDIQSFSEKLTSLVVGSDVIPYPKQARLVFVPPRLLVLILGALAVLGCAAALAVPAGARGRVRRIAGAGFAVAVIASLALAALWAHGWQPVLARHLSSKAMLETVDQLRRPGDQLVIMGDLGHAPAAYTAMQPERATSREQIVTALKRANRVFAIAPQSEICAIHREVDDKPYFVIDERNSRNLLMSNRLDGATDNNPLRDLIAHHEPPGIRSRPKGEVVWDNRIQLIGWDIPAQVERGERFDVVVYYKILGAVGGTWTALLHIDGAARWHFGDHKPIRDRCPTSTWQAGDYIIDRHTMTGGAGASPPGRYEIWIGFFTGSSPNFTNMPISKAPADMRDPVNRVRLTTIELD